MSRPPLWLAATLGTALLVLLVCGIWLYRAEQWGSTAGLILILILLCLMAAAAVVAGVWQRTAAEHFRALYQAQAARGEGEARYATTLMSIGDAVITTDASGRITLLNHVAEALTGVTSKEAIGRPLTSVVRLVNEDTHEAVEDPVRTAMRTGATVSLVGHTLLVDKSGVERPIADSAAPVRSESGAMIGAVLVIRDQTEERRSQKALSESEDRYRHLVELLPDAIVVHREGRFTYVNPAGVKLFGATEAQQLLGRPMIDRVHPDFRDSVRGRVQVIDSEQRSVPIVREKLLRLDGTAFDAEVTAMPFVTQGHAEVLAVAKDMTEYHKAEAEKARLQVQLLQAQKMEAVGRLAGGVAHDFNNMLTVIQGYSESILGRLKPGDPIRNDLLEVQAAAGRSANLTHQLLAFSRRQTIAPRVMDMNEQLMGMNRLLDRILGEDITLRFTLSPDLWPVYMDVAQVDQIVANLAINSRDAMPDGGVLTMETSNVSLNQEYCDVHAWVTPGEFVKLSISDTGCGMDQETLAHLFEPFFTTKAEGHGTGLGLATVFGIVKQNLGAINVYSEPGQGTTSSIFLPRYLGETASAQGPVQSPKPRGGHETILLVEDEAQLRRLAKTILERLGYTVLDAASPSDALKLCETHAGEIHLLLTDVVMPRMNGRELETHVRASRPGVKTVFMSGYTADTIAHRGVLEPGIDFLQKPFTAASLGEKVRAVIDRT